MIQEAKQDKPSISGQDTSGGNKIKAALHKAIEFIKKLLNRFIAWVQNALSKIGFSFAKEHKKEIAYVRANKELNKEIGEMLESGKFKPTVEKLPIFQLQNTNRLIGEMIVNCKHIESNLLGGALDFYSVDDIKYKIYPQIWRKELSNMDKKQINEFSELNIIDENTEIFNESIDLNKTPAKPIYVCFAAMPQEFYDHELENISKLSKDIRRKRIDDGTRVKATWKGVHDVTHSDIYHVGISLIPNLSTVFSYSVHGNITAKHGRGFVIEDWEYIYGRSVRSKMIIFAGYVSLEGYEKIEKFINHHKENASKSNYNWSEILNRIFYKKRELKEDDFKWVCSTFTNAVLNMAGATDAIKISKSPAPADITRKLTNSNCFAIVFNGEGSDYDPERIQRRAEKLLETETSSLIDKPDEENIIHGIGRSIDKSIMAERNNVLQNLILYNLDRPVTTNEFTRQYWDDLIELITGHHVTKFEKNIQDLIDLNYTIIRDIKQSIDSIEHGLDRDIHDAAVHDRDTASHDEFLRQELFLNRICLQAFTEAGKELEGSIVKIVKDKLFKTCYLIYRDTISVYNSTKKSFSESYVDTTLMNEALAFN